MAQAEDTELRDLVVEALEKNGSLAKIRALLRANIFLAFEDECENMKHNINLDNIMKLPEGILALSIIHEFLEFCNLKNTLFVYMSESRQNKEYKYEGKRNLTEKLNIHKLDYTKEPVMITILKNILNPHNKTRYIHSDNSIFKNIEKSSATYKDEQNCTYIVHEDSQSSTTSNSHSDNSSDEKNKLHLRLQLDNSDTDTSSDSARDKSCSEYIPNDHIVITDHSKTIANTQQHSGDCVDAKTQNDNVNKQKQNSVSAFMHELKATTNSSSDSTSYVNIKPFTCLDNKLINTAGVPITEVDENEAASPIVVQLIKCDLQQKKDSPKSATSSNVSSISSMNENGSINNTNQKSLEAGKSEEYSYDFTSSQVSQNKDEIDNKLVHLMPVQKTEDSPVKNSSVESQHQVSQSSQSSVSISDVADLISEKSYSFGHQANNDKSSGNKSRLSSNQSKKSKTNHNKSYSDDSGDFSESPIPSLSNLSLDIHSE